MQARDPENRAPGVTVGTGRAMLSNRISHFLDIHGTRYWSWRNCIFHRKSLIEYRSMTIDTACSGSLVSLDVACRYLNSGEVDGAIVAGCNLYLLSTRFHWNIVTS